MWEQPARRGGGLDRHRGTPLRAASSWDFRGLGFSVCVYSLMSLIGGGSNDSWPHCVSLLLFSDLGPKGLRGAKVLQMGKKVKFTQKMKTGLYLLLLEYICPQEGLC